MNIAEQASKYKRQIASRYIPVAADDIASTIIEADTYAVSVKHDGHFYVLHYDGSACTLVNYSGKVIDDLPLLTEAAEVLQGRCTEAIFAGELYFYDADNRTRAFDMTANLQNNPDRIHFAAFDIIRLDNTLQYLGVLERDTKLNELLPAAQKIHAVQNQMVESRKEVAALYASLVEKGQHEGIIARSLNGPTYKIKPKLTLDAVVLGYSEGEAERSGMLRALLVGLCTGPDEYLILTRVGGGFSEAQRLSILQELQQRKVGTDYIEVSSTRVAFTMVEPYKIVEFNCLDVFNENSKGRIQKMSLTYGKEGYKAAGKKAMVSVVSPVFECFRSDKEVNEGDVGIQQITRIISLDQEEASAVKLLPSEILRREVFVKESKGMKMVRKFLLWKTNKSTEGQYPAYVFHYTDFSPNRAEMLKKDLKVSDSKEQIESLYDESLAKNIKKGWNPV